MEDHRHNARLDWNRACQLHLHGASYPATVKNLSTMVLGVHIDGSPPDVKIGDECVVNMIYDQDCLHDEFRSQVIRVDADEIALKIIGRLRHP